MGDLIWTWACRACAVLGFIYLLLVLGFDKTPSWAFILLIGLFFGPEALRGGLQTPWGKGADK